MIKATINKRQYTIPTRWAEFTLQNYLDRIKHNPAEFADLLEVVCGLPKDIFGMLQMGDMLKIIHCMQFIYNEPQPKPAKEVSITKMPYGAYADCCNILEEAGDDTLFAIPDVLARYYAPRPYDTDNVPDVKARMLATPAYDIVLTGVEVCNQIITYARNFEAILKKIPMSKEEKAAGVDKLSDFGALLIVDNLANGDQTKYDFFFQLPVEEIHAKILLDNNKSFRRYKLEKQYEQKT